jgi:hypothetical protein
MSKYHAHLGQTRLCHSNGDYFTFKPRGSVKPYAQLWKWRRTVDQLLAARLVVGLNVGDKPTWSFEDVIKAVTDIRKGAASFIAQRGVYAPQVGPRVEEDSVQIIIFNDVGVNREAFTDEMIVLGEELAGKLKQEEIYLDIQNRGIVEDSFTVLPNR